MTLPEETGRNGENKATPKTERHPSTRLSAGVMTFEDGFKPELAARCLKKRAWGIQYLPAGNKLGYICTPNIDTNALEQTLKIVYQRNTRGKPAITIVDAGRSYEHASTMATLRQAALRALHK